MKPPILFIHGAFTRAKRWQPWLTYFRAAGHQCLAPSLPAHDPPNMKALARLTFDDYVDAMVAAHATLDGPPIVIGSSMGGLIAQHVAAEPGRPDSCLISSAPPWRGGGKLGAAPYALSYAIPIAAGWALRGNKNAALKLVLHDLSPKEQDFFLAIFADESGKAYRTMITGTAPIADGAVTCPVLCLSAAADRLFKPVVAERLAAFYNAEHLIFPASGTRWPSGALLEPIGSAIYRLDSSTRLPSPSFRPGAIV